MAAALPPSGPRGRSRRRYSARPPISDINVTPMVDVMLVLLIVFMVAAPLMTVGVSVDLPRTSAKALDGTDEPLVISIDKEGTVYLQESEVDPANLVAQLQAISSNKREETRIFVRADRDIAYGRVADIMARVTSAGFPRVALVQENDGVSGQ